MQRSGCTLIPNAESLQRDEAEAERADNTYNTLLQKLVQFLTQVLVQTWKLTMQGHATKRAHSQPQNVIEDECRNMVFETVVTWAHSPD